MVCQIFKSLDCIKKAKKILEIESFHLIFDSADAQSRSAENNLYRFFLKGYHHA